LLISMGLITVAQSVSTTLEPSKILIGEQSVITFTIEVPRGKNLQMPVFNERFNEKIEIIDYGTTDTLTDRSNDGLTIKRSLIITSWEEGFHAIAPFNFLLIEGADTLLVESEPVLYEVQTLSMEENTDLKDIKPIISVPITLAELKYYILGAILAAVLVWLFIRYLKRRKKKPVPESIWEKPDIPAHVAAISSLELLKSEKLWQQGFIKVYHTRLTDIVRHYIEKRFGVQALEMTTHELLIAMDTVIEAREVMAPLKDSLELADLVKFAKHIPSPSENETSMDIAFEFVNHTKIVAQQ